VLPEPFFTCSRNMKRELVGSTAPISRFMFLEHVKKGSGSTANVQHCLTRHIEIRNYLPVPGYGAVMNRFITLETIVFAVKEILSAVEIAVTIVLSELSGTRPWIQERQTAS